MTPVVQQTVQFSELSRNSRAVAEAADRGPVTVTRRDGEPLVLMRKALDDANREGLAMASQVVAAAVSAWPDPFVERLHAPFPWMRFLPVSEQQQFADELVQTARACASVQQFEPLLAEVAAWRSTAEAYAAGWDKAAVDWLDAPVDVTRPGDGA